MHIHGLCFMSVPQVFATHLLSLADQRNPPDQGRIGDPGDIIGTVLVENSNVRQPCSFLFVLSILFPTDQTRDLSTHAFLSRLHRRRCAATHTRPRCPSQTGAAVSFRRKVKMSLSILVLLYVLRLCQSSFMSIHQSNGSLLSLLIERFYFSVNISRFVYDTSRSPIRRNPRRQVELAAL